MFGVEIKYDGAFPELSLTVGRSRVIRAYDLPGSLPTTLLAGQVICGAVVSGRNINKHLIVK